VLRATAHVEYEDSGSKRKKKQPAATADAADAAAEAEAAAAAAGGKALVVFTEMPYQVCKVRMAAVMLMTVMGARSDCLADFARPPCQHRHSRWQLITCWEF
jgi:hypothetical protein